MDGPAFGGGDMTLHPGEDQPDEPERLDRVSRGDLAYPSHLTERVLIRWREAKTAGEVNLPLPAPADLATILSVCYHATLLREEGRPVTFRLALSEPGVFHDAAGPPSRCAADSCRRSPSRPQECALAMLRELQTCKP